jgi:DNA-binding response OmpR family regulator
MAYQVRKILPDDRPPIYKKILKMKNLSLLPTVPRPESEAADRVRPPVPARLQKILVAEDTESIRKIISRSLTDAGFDVKVVSDGEAAWGELQNEQYNLLVTDNNMPYLLGIKLVERMRDAGMNLPVLITSGSLSIRAMQNYAKLQIAAVIPKPFNIWDFQTLVKMALGADGRNIARRLGYNAVLSSPPIMLAGPTYTHGLIAHEYPTAPGGSAVVLESGGWVVDQANSGIAAFTRAIEHKRDLALFDLNLNPPHVDGWATFKDVNRAKPAFPGFVSAHPIPYRVTASLGRRPRRSR